MFVYMCLSTLVHVSWLEHERLSYPLTNIPLSLVLGSPVQSGFQKTDSLVKNGVFWGGFAVTLLASAVLCISNYYPTFHVFSPSYFIWPIFESMGEPWASVMRWPSCNFTISPLTIGVGYLVPLDSLFSIWFFRWFIKLVQIPIWYINTDQWAHYTNQNSLREWGVGAVVAAGIASLWVSRHEIKRVIRSAFSKDYRSANEPLSPRVAVMGGILALLVIAVFSICILRITPWVVALYFAGFFLGAITMARARGVIAYPSHGAIYFNWVQSFFFLFGFPILGANNFIGLNQFTSYELVQGFNNSMAHMMESYKIGDEVRIRRKSISLGLIIAFLVAIVVAWIVGLRVIYTNGMFNIFNAISLPIRDYVGSNVSYGVRAHVAHESYSHFHKFDIMVLVHQAIGALFTAFLFFMRTRFVRFPFDPYGLVLVCNEWGFANWGGFFVAWLVKAIVIRYAGVQGYRKTVPFFLGMVIAYMVVTAVAGIVGLKPIW